MGILRGRMIEEMKLRNNALRKKPWIVYAKKPFGSPVHVLDYLAWFHRFISSWLILTSDVLAAGSRKSTRMRPAPHAITSTAMFARRASRVTIPINNRHCFTQRFSPTGFILNASDSNCYHSIALGSHSG